MIGVQLSVGDSEATRAHDLGKAAAIVIVIHIAALPDTRDVDFHGNQSPPDVIAVLDSFSQTSRIPPLS
jgi:hypothetical protein